MFSWHRDVSIFFLNEVKCVSFPSCRSWFVVFCPVRDEADSVVWEVNESFASTLLCHLFSCPCFVCVLKFGDSSQQMKMSVHLSSLLLTAGSSLIAWLLLSFLWVLVLKGCVSLFCSFLFIRPYLRRCDWLSSVTLSELFFWFSLYKCNNSDFCTCHFIVKSSPSHSVCLISALLRDVCYGSHVYAACYSTDCVNNDCCLSGEKAGITWCCHSAAKTTLGGGRGGRLHHPLCLHAVSYLWILSLIINIITL